MGKQESRRARLSRQQDSFPCCAPSARNPEGALLTHAGIFSSGAKGARSCVELDKESAVEVGVQGKGGGADFAKCSSFQKPGEI